MAWLFGDGFDFASSIADVIAAGSVWDATSGGIQLLSASTRFGVGQAARLSNTCSLVSPVFTASGTVYINTNMAVYGAISGTTGMGFWRIFDGGTEQCCIILRQGGDFILTSGFGSATPIGSASPQIFSSTGVYHHLQFKLVIHNTAGSLELRVDGALTASWSLSSINTRNGTSNNQTTRITVLQSSTANQLTFSLDDYYAFNDAGAAPNTWQGDVRAVQIMPNSDTGQKNWTPNSGATNYVKVNQLTQDGDSTYVSDAGTLGDLDLYTCGSLATTPAFIVQVQGKMFARMDDAGPHTVAMRVNSSGNVQDSSTLTTVNSYNWQQMLLPVDPHTSAAWTAAGINAVQVGPRALS